MVSCFYFQSKVCCTIVQSLLMRRNEVSKLLKNYLQILLVCVPSDTPQGGSGRQCGCQKCSIVDGFCGASSKSVILSFAFWPRVLQNTRAFTHKSPTVLHFGPGRAKSAVLSFTSETGPKAK